MKVTSYKLQVISVIFISYFLLLTSTRSAYAHVLKTDGSIGAVLHISPEDDPVAGEDSSFFFDFKDKNGKFDPANCDCIGAILQNDKEIFSQPLFQNNPNPSLDDASFSYAFSGKGIYTVQVAGKPISDGFEPFILSWDIRVEREASGALGEKDTNWLARYTIHLAFIIPATIFMMYVIIKNNKKR